MRTILRNAARCRLCGDEIESTHRWNFRYCKCKAISVDGGRAYIRRSWDESRGTLDELAEDLCEYAGVEE